MTPRARPALRPPLLPLLLLLLLPAALGWGGFCWDECGLGRWKNPAGGACDAPGLGYSSICNDERTLCPENTWCAAALGTSDALAIPNACPEGTSSPPGSYACTIDACPLGYTCHIESGELEVVACPANWYCDVEFGPRRPCPAGALSPPASTYCTAGAPPCAGYFREGDGACWPHCPAGQYASADRTRCMTPPAPLAPPAAHWSAAGAWAPLASPGHYIERVRAGGGWAFTLAACPPGEVQPLWATTLGCFPTSALELQLVRCTRADAHVTDAGLALVRDDVCIDCAAPRVPWAAGAHSRLTCPAGSWAHSAANFSVGCEAGYVLQAYAMGQLLAGGPGTPVSACVPCARGRFCAAGGDALCGFGYYCPGSMPADRHAREIDCAFAPDAYSYYGLHRTCTLNDGTTLDPCPDAFDRCLWGRTRRACAPGTYNVISTTATRADGCAACPDGFACPGVDARCPAGHALGAGGCESAERAGMMPLPCPRGSVAAPGSAACYACTPTACADCDWNQVALAPTIGDAVAPEVERIPAACTPCAAGSTPNAAHDACVACPVVWDSDCPKAPWWPAAYVDSRCAHAYDSVDRNFQWVSPTAWYCTGGAPPRLPADGLYVADAAAAPVACPAGAYCADARAPVTCPAGTWAPEPGARACAACPEAMWCAGGASATPCPPNTWTPPGAGAEADCRACPRGYSCGAEPVRYCTRAEYISDIACTPCASGFTLVWNASAVSDRCAPCDTLCSGHGACQRAPVTALPECACVFPYAGSGCASCAGGAFRHAASGECRLCPGRCAGGGRGACGADGACICPWPWAGAACDACVAGTVRVSATECAPCPDACSAHGECRVLGTERAGAPAWCDCEPGWAGAGCGARAPNYPSNLVDAPACSPPCAAGAGTCIAVGGVALCLCEPAWSGAYCQFTLEAGTAHAACGERAGERAHGEPRSRANATCTEACGARGACANGACACDAGWARNRTSGAACAAFDACAAQRCGGHGRPVPDAAGACACECFAGWSGAACGAAQHCAGASCVNGACDAKTGACACALGWVGERCTVPLACDCQHLGRCTWDALTTRTACTCLPGWGDALCRIDVNECSALTAPCSGHGACVNTPGTYHCTCDAAWYEAACEWEDHCIAVPNHCNSDTEQGTCVTDRGAHTSACTCAARLGGATCALHDVCSAPPYPRTHNYCALTETGAGDAPIDAGCALEESGAARCACPLGFFESPVPGRVWTQPDGVVNPEPGLWRYTVVERWADAGATALSGGSARTRAFDTLFEESAPGAALAAARADACNGEEQWCVGAMPSTCALNVSSAESWDATGAAITMRAGYWGPQGADALTPLAMPYGLLIAGAHVSAAAALNAATPRIVLDARVRGGGGGGAAACVGDGFACSFLDGEGEDERFLCWGATPSWTYASAAPALLAEARTGYVELTLDSGGGMGPALFCGAGYICAALPGSGVACAGSAPGVQDTDGALPAGCSAAYRNERDCFEWYTAEGPWKRWTPGAGVEDAACPPPATLGVNYTEAAAGVDVRIRGAEGALFIAAGGGVRTWRAGRPAHVLAFAGHVALARVWGGATATQLVILPLDAAPALVAGAALNASTLTLPEDARSYTVLDFTPGAPLARRTCKATFWGAACELRDLRQAAVYPGAPELDARAHPLCAGSSGADADAGAALNTLTETSAPRGVNASCACAPGFSAAPATGAWALRADGSVAWEADAAPRPAAATHSRYRSATCELDAGEWPVVPDAPLALRAAYEAPYGTVYWTANSPWGAWVQAAGVAAETAGAPPLPPSLNASELATRFPYAALSAAEGMAAPYALAWAARGGAPATWGVQVTGALDALLWGADAPLVSVAGATLDGCAMWETRERGGVGDARWRRVRVRTACLAHAGGADDALLGVYATPGLALVFVRAGAGEYVLTVNASAGAGAPATSAWFNPLPWYFAGEWIGSFLSPRMHPPYYCEDAELACWEQDSDSFAYCFGGVTCRPDDDTFPWLCSIGSPAPVGGCVLAAYAGAGATRPTTVRVTPMDAALVLDGWSCGVHAGGGLHIACWSGGLVRAAFFAAGVEWARVVALRATTRAVDVLVFVGGAGAPVPVADVAWGAYEARAARLEL